MRTIMAVPITPTPVLEGKEAADFIKTILKEQNIKVPLTPLPRIEEARKKIRENANARKE